MFRSILLLIAVAGAAAQDAEQRRTNTEGHFGAIYTDKRAYRPLDLVKVEIRGRASGDRRCRIRVADPAQRVYFERDVDLTGNRGAVSFPASGPLGSHYVYLGWPGELRYSRYLNFRLDAETGVETGDPDFDRLFPFTREAVLLGRRDYQTKQGRFVGYIAADTLRFDGIWLRDWIYSLPAYRHWEQQMLSGLDRFLETQNADGMIPDGIQRDGRTWRVGLESDVEYILVLGVWQSWQATGDDAWLRSVLPKLEKALAYIQSDSKHWDSTNQLVKRQHSCDTWDFDIDGAGSPGGRRHVIATCDQSGYYQAFQAMSLMCRGLGDETAAQSWAGRAREYRERARKLLWDGTKFLHHVHIDLIDHDGFDESKQLAMGNTWAVTRGLATREQSASIIDEYRRRHKETGDAYPWWSLQPGYPDDLNYWKDSFRRQGGYANGGLMPWVGGELCRGAFQNGRETYGVELLRQYAAHLRKTGGAQVWYWPDGTPGFRTHNEINYAGWGMAPWVQALLEGLGGISDLASTLRVVEVAPRWPATTVKRARVTVRYAASGGYFSYVWSRGARNITITFSGSGEKARVRVLMPFGVKPKAVVVDGKPGHFDIEHIAGSEYVRVGTTALRGSLAIEYE